MDFPKNVLEPKIYTHVVNLGGAEDVASSAQLSLSLRAKILYGIGEISNSIKSFTFGLFLLFFYTSVLGLPGTLVGVATALSLVWDALIDPFIGHLSDKTYSRLGRRHPFMLVGTIGMGISFFLIFNPPAGLSTGALFGWLITTNIVLRTTNSIFIVPYHALGAELNQDYDDRTSITAYRAGLALLGTLAAAGLSFVVFFPNTTPGVDPKFNLGGYSSMGLAFGLAIMLVGMVATFGTLSQRAKGQTAHASEANDIGFWAGLGLSVRNPSFRALTISTAIFFLASVINATLAVHYLTYYTRIVESSSLSLFQASFFIGAIPGVVFWAKMARRVDKHHIYIGATVAVALLMAAAYWLVGDGNLFGTGNIVPLLIGNGLAGFFASAIWVVPASMIADVADQDELQSRRRREGTFFGIHSFFLQEAASIAILVAGVLVDHFAGLVPGQIEQSPQTINRLALLFSLLPAMLLLGAVFLMSGYRLSREQVEKIQSELAGRRIKKV